MLAEVQLLDTARPWPIEEACALTERSCEVPLPGCFRHIAHRSLIVTAPSDASRVATPGLILVTLTCCDFDRVPVGLGHLRRCFTPCYEVRRLLALGDGWHQVPQSSGGVVVNLEFARGPVLSSTHADRADSSELLSQLALTWRGVPAGRGGQPGSETLLGTGGPSGAADGNLPWWLMGSVGGRYGGYGGR